MRKIKLQRMRIIETASNDGKEFLTWTLSRRKLPAEIRIVITHAKTITATKPYGTISIKTKIRSSPIAMSNKPKILLAPSALAFTSTKSSLLLEWFLGRW